MTSEALDTDIVLVVSELFASGFWDLVVEVMRSRSKKSLSAFFALVRSLVPDLHKFIRLRSEGGDTHFFTLRDLRQGFWDFARLLSLEVFELSGFRI